MATGKRMSGGRAVPVQKEIMISRSRYPESAKHIEDAIALGQPKVLTIERGGANVRRREALKGTPVRKGYDRDEYPPAFVEQGGGSSSKRYISPSDNRGSGACMGNQCRSLPNGTKFIIRVH